MLVNFARLQAAIDHMASFEQQVTEALEDIDHTMAALRANWNGDASESQKQAQQRWESGAEQMKAALTQLQTITQAAHTNYSNAVSKNGQMWA